MLFRSKGTLPKGSRTREGLAAEQVEDLGETGKKPKPHADKKHGDRKHGERKHSGHRGDAKKHDEPKKHDAAMKPDKPVDGPKRNRQRRRVRRDDSSTAAE